MTTEYTQGKWYVALNGKIMVKSGEQFIEICQMPFGSTREADEMPEANANASLIAKAPIMYEALKRIVDEGTHCWEHQPHKPVRQTYDIDTVDRIARQAILNRMVALVYLME